MKRIVFLLVTLITVFTASTKITSVEENIIEVGFKEKLSLIEESTYRFPLGDSLGRGYYIAQHFQDSSIHQGTHLGIDISGIGEINSDFGDTIYSINNGYVNEIQNNHKEYLSIYYKLKGNYIKAVYLHCSKIFCNPGDYVFKGEAIATVGNSDGAYAAHLHLELMSDTTKWFGAYGLPEGFIDPEKVIPHYKTRKK